MAAKNITRIADHPMFGKQGQKGASPSWPGRKIIPFITTEEVDSVARGIPREFAKLPCPSREEVCRILRKAGVL